MEKKKEDFAKILPPWKTAPKSVVFVLKDVLLEKEVFWKLTGTTVFGFAWDEGVHAVIPWEKLGLALKENGKFNIVGSKMSRGQAEKDEARDVSVPAKPIVLNIKRHKFILGYSEEKEQWCFALPKDTLLRVEHLRAGERDYHACGSQKLAGAECKHFCELKHGDYVRITWRIHPSDGYKREGLVFAFYDHEEPYEEPKGTTILMLNDTVLPKVLSYLTPKEYIHGIGLTTPKINSILKKNMPWKELELRYTLDGLRTAKMSSAGDLCTVTCKVAPPQGICSAAPEPEEFLENFRGLLTGTNLMSLTVWDTTLLHNAPTLENLKNLHLLKYEGAPGSFNQLACLKNAPVERVKMSAVKGLHGREFFNLLPKATKLHLGFSPQKEFWSTSTKAQVAAVTHLYLEMHRTWSDVSTECPILLMHNLEFLRINEKKPLCSAWINFGFHERLETMSFSVLVLADDQPPPDHVDFWARVRIAAPNLENLRIVCDEADDAVVLKLCQNLKKLKRVVLLQTKVSVNGVRDIMKNLPCLEYLRVESKSIEKMELPREDLLGHGAADCVLDWTFVPHASSYTTSRDFDLKFFWIKLAGKEAKRAEEIFEI